MNTGIPGASVALRYAPALSAGLFFRGGSAPGRTSATRESPPAATFDWLLDHSIPFNRFILKHVNERLGQLMAAKEHAWLLSMEQRVAAARAMWRAPRASTSTGRCSSWKGGGSSRWSTAASICWIWRD